MVRYPTFQGLNRPEGEIIMSPIQCWLEGVGRMGLSKKMRAHSAVPAHQAGGAEVREGAALARADELRGRGGSADGRSGGG